MAKMLRTFFPTRFFRGVVDPHEFRELENLAVRVRFGANRIIFSESDLADSIFGVSKGFVRLYKLLPDGRRQILSFALPGEFFGMPIASRYNLSADAIGEVVLSRFHVPS